MDASGRAPIIRRRKSREWQKGNSGKDIISNLPEFVLGHILSFLPTKDAVRTCVLSTRWKYTWTLVTNLRIDDRLRYSRMKIDKSHFMDFVDRILNCGNSTIPSLFFSCKWVYDESRVNAWISTVTRRKVQKLDIRYSSKKLVTKPVSSCDWLIELRLYLNCPLFVPSSSYFSNLKILDIKGVTLLSECCSDYTTIFCFPVLKVLNVSKCACVGNSVDINAPALESFTLEDFNARGIIGTLKCVIKICGQRLINLKYRGLSEDLFLPSPSTIVNATVASAAIDYSPLMYFDLICDHNVGLRASALLNQLPNIVCLTLCSRTAEVLAKLEDMEARLPTFDKLTHLELGMESELWGLKGYVKMMDLLQCSPNLECLIFAGENFDSDYVDIRTGMVSMGTVPQCFLSCLKVVLFKEFKGANHVICLMKFLLENSEVLEKMTINAAPGRKIEEDVKKQLLSFPRASSRTSVVFLS